MTEAAVPFGRWFGGSDARMEAGNLSDVRGVGSEVLERRINVGPATGSISAGTETPR